MSTLQVPDNSILFDQAVLRVRSAFSRTPWLELLLTIAEMLADLASVEAAVFLAYVIYHFLGLGRNLRYAAEHVGLFATLLGLLFVVLLHLDGAYQKGNSLLRIRETERVLRVSCEAFLLVFLITFFAAELLSRITLALCILLIPLFLTVQKQLFFLVIRTLHVHGYGVENVLIYGAGYTGRRVFSALVRSPKVGFHPVVLVDDDPSLENEQVFESDYRRERSATILQGPVSKELIKRYNASMVVIAIPTLEREKFARVVHAAAAANARVAFVPSQIAPSDVSMEYADIDGLLLGSFANPVPRTLYEFSKRIFDFLAALVILVAVAPLLLVISALIRLESRGPILFSQKRVGKQGKEFKLYKFRSMHPDAPAYSFSPKQAHDPRITRVGRVLRRTSLDELPQLFNVLKGEMSLVGPRPEMPFIVEQYGARHRQRLHVKPGITGLWQLSADRAFLIHENIQYDLYYIKHRSFFMDVAILLHTLVFAMRGV